MQLPDIPAERSHDFLFKDADSSKPGQTAVAAPSVRKPKAARTTGPVAKRVVVPDALFKEKDSLDYGLVRIRVRHHGRLTTISLDEIMYKIAILLIPGQGMFEAWIQDAISTADQHDAENPGAASVRNKSGFSRQVQRRVLQMIIQTLQKR